MSPILNPEFVLGALQLAVTAELSREQLLRPFSSVTTDSRSAKPGCLFVAIPGEKFDGHDFIDTALAAGATGVLCRRGAKITPAANTMVFQVEDSLEGYRRIAAAWRLKFQIPVIVVAGSVGKTTTKDLLAAILLGKFSSVLKTQGSRNGYVGIPMTLIELRPDHQAAVIEVGIDEIGAMKQHASTVQATAAVLTSIGPEHLEKLCDVPTVAREEGIALSSVAATGGFIVINLDDPWISSHFSALQSAQKIGFSVASAELPAGALAARWQPDTSTVDVSGGPAQWSAERFDVPLPGSHNASNLMAAVSVAAGLGLTPDEIRKGLASFRGAEGRSELRNLPGPTPVLCDYYNSNPTSLSAALTLITEIAGASRKSRWVCLGDMLELGPAEEKFHRELATQLISLGVEHVLLFGPRMRWLHEELGAQGAVGVSTHHATHESLAKALCQGVEPGKSAILIKGSRGMKMEEVWKILEKERTPRCAPES